ncbi:MAG: proprotein convertase P-domain-containing protein [Candidatus Latescibacterota bacterium]
MILVLVLVAGSAGAQKNETGTPASGPGSAVRGLTQTKNAAGALVAPGIPLAGLPAKNADIGAVAGPGPRAKAEQGTQTFRSRDVPKTIADLGSTTSTLTVDRDLTIGDLNLRFESLRHTSMADLRIELRSPAGTSVVLVKSFPQQGILVGLGTPDNFINTVLDDEAATNLAAGGGPLHRLFQHQPHLGGVVAPVRLRRPERARHLDPDYRR